MLTRTLTRAEIAELLDIAPEVVDALLESGQLLCQFSKGEPRVPLTQLESFFRDRLMRVYQAEVSRPSEESAAAPVFATPEPLREPAAEVPRESSPAAEASTDREPDREAEPEPSRRQSASRAAVSPAASHDSPDLRAAQRYVPLRPITGMFQDLKFSIVQMSSTGLRIRHNEPLLPGTEGKLSFALLRPARSFVMRARVVWTSLAKSGDERFSISGLRITEHVDRLEHAVELLSGAHELQPERRNLRRRATDAIEALEGISDEEIALVTSAIQKFATDPVEASRWYSRARFALSEESVRRLAPARPREREEVLGIWEYLDRQIDIPKITGVVTWMRTAN
ncbi:MAG TPA: PilZ domain-containing protein [Thermoanaerobaculia bacterium]|jgi:hypothetical protein